VLQSAEANEGRGDHLEQFMEKADVTKRGTVVLATVKGECTTSAKISSRSFFKDNAMT